MDTAPVLLLAYNRPEKLLQLIDALRPLQPPLVLISIDGPKTSKPGDHELVANTQKMLDRIDWSTRIETRIRTTNLGLKLAVEDSVNWATSQYGKVIVIEDDACPGPQLVDYLGYMLEKYRTEERVMHISGYNVVPPLFLNSTTGSRYSKYPESFAWATWEQAWKKYDPLLEWGINVSINELTKITGSRVSALRWKINFCDAASGRIGSWAYRWLASIWSTAGITVAPNQNLMTYTGFAGGTHTFRKPRWDDLPIKHLDYVDSLVFTDESAEQWTGTRIFRESTIGLVDGVAASAAMSIRAKWRTSGASKIRI
jgi:hypothetical protein